MGLLKKYQRESAPGGFVDLPAGYPSGSVKQLVHRIAYARYDFAVDGGAVSTITPATNWIIPSGALVKFNVVFSPTAVTSSGSATVAVGTSAGSSTTSLLAATAKASLGANVVTAGVANTVPFRMSAAGSITVTIGTAALTAGVLEIMAEYWMPVN